MTVLKRGLQALWKLFVDETGIALLLIAWIAIACFVLPDLALGNWSGPVLFLGTAFILTVGLSHRR